MDSEEITCPVCDDPVDTDADYIEIDTRHYLGGDMHGIGTASIHEYCWQTVLDEMTGDTEQLDP